MRDIDDSVLVQRILEHWWRSKAKILFSNEVNEVYESVFKKYDLIKPAIHIKKMKTLWGSCTPAKNKVTFNEYLLKADIRCIRYVVLHELTHLLHPYHNADFYNFLTVQMPDWKSRKEQLDKEVVQGL